MASHAPEWLENPTAPVSESPPTPVRDPEDTELYQRWHKSVAEPPENDFFITISAHSQTPVSGTGKSTLAIRLGQRFDRSDSGFDPETQITFDAGELAYEVLPGVEDKSAVIFDEAQGAPKTASVNARRGQTNEAIDAINGILAARSKSFTVIVISQQLQMLDKNLLPLTDAWLLIVREPGAPDGPVAVHHELTMSNYDLSNPSIKTPAIEDLEWQALPSDDPAYRALEAKKEAARTGEGQDGNEPTDPDVVHRREQAKTALRLTQLGGMSFREAAKYVDYSKSWVSDRVQEWQDGAHQDLLDSGEVGNA